jgi:hypothetical protein
MLTWIARRHRRAAAASQGTVAFRRCRDSSLSRRRSSRRRRRRRSSRRRRRRRRRRSSRRRRCRSRATAAAASQDLSPGPGRFGLRQPTVLVAAGDCPRARALDGTPWARGAVAWHYWGSGAQRSSSFDWGCGLREKLQALKFLGNLGRVPRNFGDPTWPGGDKTNRAALSEQRPHEPPTLMAGRG